MLDLESVNLNLRNTIKVCEEGGEGRVGQMVEWMFFVSNIQYSLGWPYISQRTFLNGSGWSQPKFIVFISVKMLAQFAGLEFVSCKTHGEIIGGRWTGWHWLSPLNVILLILDIGTTTLFIWTLSSVLHCYTWSTNVGLLAGMKMTPWECVAWRRECLRWILFHLVREGWRE